MNMFTRPVPSWKMAGFGAVYMLLLADPFSAFALLLYWWGGQSDAKLNGLEVANKS